MRLDKYLSDCGVDTRSKCKSYIRQGRVIVNGAIVKDASVHMKEGDAVYFDGKQLILQKHLYYMFHKPAGCICATKDDSHKIVLDYFPEQVKKRLLIVGRLDKDTEGLLFLTDDGAFVHHLMAPGRHVEKTYYFEASGQLLKNAVSLLHDGIDIGDEKKTAPAGLEIIQETSGVVKGKLSITEGRYHQVKRMIKAMGGDIFYLKRISIGQVVLDDTLRCGQYRELSVKEFDLLNYKREN